MEWAVVRPDGLIDVEQVTPYDVSPSPTTTITSAGETTRMNVAHFMTELVTEPTCWAKWKGMMPFILNKPASE